MVKVGIYVLTPPVSVQYEQTDTALHVPFVVPSRLDFQACSCWEKTLSVPQKFYMASQTG